MNVQLIPIGNRILCDPIRMDLNSELLDPAKRKIVIPGTVDYEGPSCGRILRMPEMPLKMCGHKACEGHTHELKVGDVILFSRFEATLINHESHQYLLVDESKVEAKMGQPPARQLQVEKREKVLA